MAATRDAGFGDEVKRRISSAPTPCRAATTTPTTARPRRCAASSQTTSPRLRVGRRARSPTAPTTAFKLGDKLETRWPCTSTTSRPSPPTSPASPACRVPSGLADEDGLPTGFQILAPAMADDRLYAVGARSRSVLPRRGAARCWTGPPSSAGNRTRMPERGRPRRTRRRSPTTRRSRRFDPVMGLEVHVELNTATKMFCGCPTGFGAEPNTQVCPVCLGLPGAAGRQRKAVESAIRIGLALNCRSRRGPGSPGRTTLPGHAKNFQTSQYDEPIASTYLDVELEDGTTYGRDRARPHGGGHRQVAARRRLHRSHPRRDPLARRLQPRRHPAHRDRHQADEGAGERAPEIARAYVATLRDLLKALGVSDVRMEQGSMRCDVNLSSCPRAHEAGHALRDQERRLAAIGRAGRALEIGRHGAILTAAARSCRRRVTGTRTPASRRPVG